MGELRAQTDGLEVVVRFDDAEGIDESIRNALIELAASMEAEMLSDTEVEGFAVGGLNIGSLRTTQPISDATGSAWSCWGFSKTGGQNGGASCTWYRRDDGPVADDCGLYTI